MTGDAPGYPKRDSHFAHHFVRVLHKSCAAQDIGRDACLLLCFIAHTEDAARYSGAVRFWNSQLMETMGFKSPKQLTRVRSVAIEAGWLDYQRQHDRSVGMYFVKIPPRFRGLTDTPIESGSESLSIPPAEQKVEWECPRNVPLSGMPSYPIPKTKKNHSSFHSPIDIFLEGKEGESNLAQEGQTAGKFDMSDVNWEDVGFLVEDIARRIPPRSQADRRAWLKYAVLCQTTFGADWMLDAACAVLAADDSTKGRQAHFVGVLRSKALEKHGVDNASLKVLMRRIEIPSDIWKSPILEVRK